MTEKNLYKTKPKSSGNYKTEQSNKTSQAKENKKMSETENEKAKGEFIETEQFNASEKKDEKVKGIEKNKEEDDDLSKELQIEETKYMRMHAKIGADMLEECEFTPEICNAVHHHHENYDGPDCL